MGRGGGRSGRAGRSRGRVGHHSRRTGGGGRGGLTFRATTHQRVKTGSPRPAGGFYSSSDGCFRISMPDGPGFGYNGVKIHPAPIQTVFSAIMYVHNARNRSFASTMPLLANNLFSAMSLGLSGINSAALQIQFQELAQLQQQLLQCNTNIDQFNLRTMGEPMSAEDQAYLAQQQLLQRNLQLQTQNAGSPINLPGQYVLAPQPQSTQPIQVQPQSPPPQYMQPQQQQQQQQLQQQQQQQHQTWNQQPLQYDQQPTAPANPHNGPLPPPGEPPSTYNNNDQNNTNNDQNNNYNYQRQNDPNMNMNQNQHINDPNMNQYQQESIESKDIDKSMAPPSYQASIDVTYQPAQPSQPYQEQYQSPSQPSQPLMSNMPSATPIQTPSPPSLIDQFKEELIDSKQVMTEPFPLSDKLSQYYGQPIAYTPDPTTIDGQLFLEMVNVVGGNNISLPLPFLTTPLERKQWLKKDSNALLYFLTKQNKYRTKIQDILNQSVCQSYCNPITSIQQSKAKERCCYWYGCCIPCCTFSFAWCCSCTNCCYECGPHVQSYHTWIPLFETVEDGQKMKNTLSSKQFFNHIDTTFRSRIQSAGFQYEDKTCCQSFCLYPCYYNRIAQVIEYYRRKRYGKTNPIDLSVASAYIPPLPDNILWKQYVQSCREPLSGHKEEGIGRNPPQHHPPTREAGRYWYPYYPEYPFLAEFTPNEMNLVLDSHQRDWRYFKTLDRNAIVPYQQQQTTSTPLQAQPIIME